MTFQSILDRSFIRSAYVAQYSTKGSDPLSRKLPSDHVIPDIAPEQDAPSDTPVSADWSGNSKSEDIIVDEMSRPNLRKNDPNNFIGNMSRGTTPEDLTDASNRFIGKPADGEISSAEKYGIGQSQVGEVPAEDEETNDVGSVWAKSFNQKYTPKEYMSDLKDEVKDVKDYVKEKASDLKEGLSERASAAKDKQDEWMRKSSESYDDVKQQAKEKTNDTMRKAKAKTSDTMEKAKEKTSDAMEKIKEMPHMIKEKVKDFTGIGKQEKR